MALLDCWSSTGTPTRNGVVTVGNNETTPLYKDLRSIRYPYEIPKGPAHLYWGFRSHVWSV